MIVVTAILSFSAFNNASLFDKWIYSPYKTKHYGEYYRIISHMFIHADVTHLVFNLFSLYFLGSFLEYQWIGEFGTMKGELHFLAVYFLGGFFATLIPYIRHQENPSYQSLGASGAVSAVIFAAILWNPNMELGLLFIPIPIPAYVFGPLYLAFEFFADKRGKGNIAHDAHIGGALFGIIYVLIINIDKGKEFFSIILGG